MPAEDIPQLTPEEEMTIKELVDELPWRDDVEPLPSPPDDGEEERAAEPDLDEWVARVTATLRRLGYDASVPDKKNVLVELESDVTYGHHGVVVRWQDYWPDGVGCCLYDAKRHDIKTTLLIVRPTDADVGITKVVKRTLAGNVPPVGVWVLTEATRMLDMGDGRVVEVD